MKISFFPYTVLDRAINESGGDYKIHWYMVVWIVISFSRLNKELWFTPFNWAFGKNSDGDINFGPFFWTEGLI
jgi:hypothetical protein